MSNQGCNQASAKNPSFTMPEVTRDVTTNNSEAADYSIDNQWSFVQNPEFSIHNVNIQSLPQDSAEVFNPLYDASTRTRSPQCENTMTPFDDMSGLYSFQYINNTHKQENDHECIESHSSPNSVNSKNSNSQTVWYGADSSQNHFSLPLETRHEHLTASESLGGTRKHYKDDIDVDQSDTISNSVKSMWNNFKNGGF